MYTIEELKHSLHWGLYMYEKTKDPVFMNHVKEINKQIKLLEKRSYSLNNS